MFSQLFPVEKFSLFSPKLFICWLLWMFIYHKIHKSFFSHCKEILFSYKYPFILVSFISEIWYVDKIYIFFFLVQHPEKSIFYQITQYFSHHWVLEWRVSNEMWISFEFPSFFKPTKLSSVKFRVKDGFFHQFSVIWNRL